MFTPEFTMEGVPVRSVLVFTGGYLGLFLLHIVFAAQDLDLLFAAVALLLVGLTFLCGPVLLAIERLNNERTAGTEVETNHLFTTGFLLSLPLSLGIAYAYAEMVVEPKAMGAALLITTATHAVARVIMARTQGEQNTEMLVGTTPE